jgi:hypothetical protein
MNITIRTWSGTYVPWRLTVGEVIQFPLHRTKAWRENKKFEQELLGEIQVLDAEIAAIDAAEIAKLNRELWALAGLEYPGEA